MNGSTPRLPVKIDRPMSGRGAQTEVGREVERAIPPNEEVGSDHRLPDQKRLNLDPVHGQPKLGAGDAVHTSIIRSYPTLSLARLPTTLMRTAFP